MPPPPRSGGLADSTLVKTGRLQAKGRKAKGKGSGQTFAKVASKAASKPIGVEPPKKQTKITNTFPPRSAPPPTRPSIVLSLLYHTLTSTLKATAATVLVPVLVKSVTPPSPPTHNMPMLGCLLPSGCPRVTWLFLLAWCLPQCALLCRPSYQLRCQQGLTRGPLHLCPPKC